MPNAPSCRITTVTNRAKNEIRVSIGTSRCLGNTSRRVSVREADTRNDASNMAGRKNKATGMKTQVAPRRINVERGMAFFGFIATGKLGELGR